MDVAPPDLESPRRTAPRSRATRSTSPTGRGCGCWFSTPPRVVCQAIQEYDTFHLTDAVRIIKHTRPLDEERDEPPDLPSWPVRLRGPAALGGEQPSRTGRPAASHATARESHPLPPAGRGRSGAARGPADQLGATDAALYLCAVTTGLRQGELLALKWLDVDWLARRIRVADNIPRGHTDEPDTPKSHSLRSLPMAGGVAGGLRGTRHPLTGRPYDASALRNRFYQCLERAGVRRVTFHELRHTRWRPPVHGCGRSRNGWGTPTPRPLRSTRATRPTQPTGLPASRRPSGLSRRPRH